MRAKTKKKPPAIPISIPELRRRLTVFRGPNIKSKEQKPESGKGKSKQFRIWDIALLSRIHRSALQDFIADRIYFGALRQRKLYRAILEVEQGLVVKSQYGVYHFHDTPQRSPVRIMRIDLATGKITANRNKPVENRMPSFKKLLGRF